MHNPLTTVSLRAMFDRSGGDPPRTWWFCRKRSGWECRVLPCRHRRCYGADWYPPDARWRRIPRGSDLSRAVAAFVRPRS